MTEREHVVVVQFDNEVLPQRYDLQAVDKAHAIERVMAHFLSNVEKDQVYEVRVYA